LYFMFFFSSLGNNNLADHQVHNIVVTINMENNIHSTRKQKSVGDVSDERYCVV